MTEKQLAEFFVEERVLQPSQADDVLSEVELNGKSVAQAMIDGGFIHEPSFYETIANGLGTDFLYSKRNVRSRRRFCVSFPAAWRGCTARCRLT